MKVKFHTPEKNLIFFQGIMDFIEIGKVTISGNRTLDFHKEIFRMDRNEAITQLKENKFISNQNIIFSFDEVIFYAVCRNEETFKVLFEEGLIPSYIPNEFGYTLLMLACSNMKYKTVKLLLERGDDVNFRSKKGSNALGLIASIIDDFRYDSANIRKLLFAYGVDIKNRKENGNNILHTLSKYEHDLQDFVRDILIEASLGGKDYLKDFLEEKDLQGNTALILAAKNNSIGIIREFLTFGADGNFIDPSGKTFLEYLLPKNKGIIEDFIEVSEIRKRRYKKGISRN